MKENLGVWVVLGALFGILFGSLLTYSSLSPKVVEWRMVDTPVGTTVKLPKTMYYSHRYYECVPIELKEK
jgi:hypothetical protein